MRRAALAAFVLAVVAACGSAAAGGSGARIVVTAGPTCPVQRNPPDPRCRPKPVEAVVRITTRSGKPVATVRTGADGKASKRLKAGSYSASASKAKPGIMPACRPVDFVVKRGHYTRVAISCDTGIR